MATETPNSSFAAPSGAVNLAPSVLSVQPPVAGLVKTYAAPGPTSTFAPFSSYWGWCAPTTTVSSSNDTEIPNLSFATPSEAVSLAVSVASAQPPFPGLVKT